MVKPHHKSLMEWSNNYHKRFITCMNQAVLSIGSFQTLFPKKTKVRPIKKVWWYSYWASKISPKYRIWGRRCLRRRRKSIKTTKTFPLRQKCQNVKIFKIFFYHQINHTNTLISTWIRWKILINSRVIENVRFLEFSW